MAGRGKIKLKKEETEFQGKPIPLIRFAFDVIRNSVLRLEKNSQNRLAVWEGAENNDYGSEDFLKVMCGLVFRYQISGRNKFNQLFNEFLDELKSAKTFKSMTYVFGKGLMKATEDPKYAGFHKLLSSLAVSCEFVLYLYTKNLEMHMNEVAKYWFEGYFKLEKKRFESEGGLDAMYIQGTCEKFRNQEKFINTFLLAYMNDYEDSVKKHHNIDTLFNDSLDRFEMKQKKMRGEETIDYSKYLNLVKEKKPVSPKTTKVSSEIDGQENTGLEIRPQEELSREVGDAVVDDTTSPQNLARDSTTHPQGSYGRQRRKGKSSLLPNVEKGIEQIRQDDSKTDVTENTGLGTRPIEEILLYVGADVADIKSPQNLARGSAGRQRKKGKSSLPPNVEKDIGQKKQDDPEMDVSENSGLELRPHEEILRDVDATVDNEKCPQNLARDSPTHRQRSCSPQSRKKGKFSPSPNVEKGIGQIKQDDSEVDRSENSGVKIQPCKEMLRDVGAAVANEKSSPQKLVRDSPIHHRRSAGRQVKRKGKSCLDPSVKKDRKLRFDTSKIDEASSQDPPKHHKKSFSRKRKSILSIFFPMFYSSEHTEIADLSLDSSPTEQSLNKKFSDTDAYDRFIQELLSVGSESSNQGRRQTIVSSPPVSVANDVTKPKIFTGTRPQNSSNVEKGIGQFRQDKSKINVPECTDDGFPSVEEVLRFINSPFAYYVISPLNIARNSPTQHRDSLNQQKKLKFESSLSPNVKKDIGQLSFDTSVIPDATSPQNHTGEKIRNSPEHSVESAGQHSTLKSKCSLSPSMQKDIGDLTVPSEMSQALMLKMFNDSETFDEFCQKVMSFYSDKPVEENEESQNIVNSPPVSVAVIANDTSTQILAQDSTIHRRGSAGQEGKYVEKGLRGLGLDTSEIDEATSPQNFAIASSRESPEHSGRSSSRQSKSILSPNVQREIGDLSLDSLPMEQSLPKKFSDTEASDEFIQKPVSVGSEEPVKEYRESFSQDRGQNVANSTPGSFADDATSPERFTGARPKDATRMRKGSSGWQKSRSKLHSKEKKDTEE